MNKNSSGYQKKRNRLLQGRHRRNLKKKAVEYKGGKCEICGYNKNNGSMVFHHKNPTEKDFGIGVRTKSNWDSVKFEIDKCMLLCANCHGEIHEKEYEQNLFDLEKELNIMPRRYGRKCLVCKSIFEAENKNQRKCSECSALKKEFQKVDVDIEMLKKIVWEKSISRIAKEFNCGPTSITRLCQKHNIQRPLKKFHHRWPSNDELAKLVFSKPLIHLAKDFGISDNAVRKRCKKNQIELPPAGYWLRKK